MSIFTSFTYFLALSSNSPLRPIVRIQNLASLAQNKKSRLHVFLRRLFFYIFKLQHRNEVIKQIA